MEETERTPLTHSVHVDGYDVVAVRNALHSLRLKAHRILALLCLFDALFCFLLWALVCQGFNGSFHGNYIYDSVVNFRFKSSLFDVICIAVGRCLLLLLVYWTLRWTTSIPMIFSTAASTIFLLAKVFYYSFEANTHPTDYIVFIAAFILPWTESYVWVSRVSPLNKKLAILYGSRGGKVTHADVHQLLVEHRGVEASLRDMSAVGYGYYDSARGIQGDPDRKLLVTHSSHDSHLYQQQQQQQQQRRDESSSDGSAFGTPPNDFGTASVAPPQPPPAGETGTLRRPPSIARDPLAATLASLSPKDITFIREAGDALKFTHEVASNPGLWEKKRDKSGVVIRAYRDMGSLHSAGSYVLMMSEGLVMGSPAELFRFLYEDLASQPLWNKDVTGCQSLQRLDSHTDVVYTELCARGTAGMISSRDFVDVRRWQKQQDGYVIATTGIEYDACPAKRRHIRGVHGYGGLVLQAVEGQPRVTNLKWVLHVDMRITGIMSARVQGDACMQMLAGYHENLRAFLEEQAKAQNAGMARAPANHNYA